MFNDLTGYSQIWFSKIDFYICINEKTVRYLTDNCPIIFIFVRYLLNISRISMNKQKLSNEQTILSGKINKKIWDNTKNEFCIFWYLPYWLHLFQLGFKNKLCNALDESGRVRTVPVWTRPGPSKFINSGFETYFSEVQFKPLLHWVTMKWPPKIVQNSGLYTDRSSRNP